MWYIDVICRLDKEQVKRSIHLRIKHFDICRFKYYN